MIIPICPYDRFVPEGIGIPLCGTTVNEKMTEMKKCRSYPFLIAVISLFNHCDHDAPEVHR
jgi:hypothetical protein